MSNRPPADAPSDGAGGPAEPRERTIVISALARVEGEGALTVRLRDGRVDDVQLRIFEAPRFFEAFLRGRTIHEVPDITARICGICPVAYQMSSCHALEALLGIELPEPLRKLRRLLYCGEWIESHVLHVAFLHAPDFLGFESAFAMAQARPEYAERVRAALELKKAGNAIVRVLGGREIHPINVRLGGFYRVPRKDELRPVLEGLKRVQESARALVRWTASLDFPPVEHDYEFVALRHETDYPMNEGRLVSSRGLDIAMARFAEHFEEYQVPYSNALQCRRNGGGAYFVGPLARWNTSSDRAGTEVRQLASETGIAWPCRNPYTSIVARSLEVAYAIGEAIRLIEAYEPPEVPAAVVAPQAGAGAWITEAPRGILYHRYEADAGGLVTKATIIPPTSQNQRQIEEDLIRFAPAVLDLPEDEAAWRCEQVVRNYDPCISCATHSLKLKVERMIRHEGPEPVSPAPAIVGLGSPHGDDQLGWIAVDRLRLRLPAGVSAVKAASGVELLGFLVGQEDILIVDAAAPARRPGTIRSFVWPCADLAAHLPWSTHGLGLVEALQLARTLGRIPGQVAIATVEAYQSAPGSPLSPAVSWGLDGLVETILRRFSR